MADRIAFYSDNYETISEKAKIALYNQLLASSLQINDYHKRGLQWVFCPWPEKVTNDFLKQVFREAKDDGIFEKLNGTIVLINEYNFWQYAPYKEFNPPKGMKNHIFGLPKTELENCFLWQTLIHEVGHAFIDEFELLDTQTILDSNVVIKSEKKNILESWIKEFGSDMIALRTIGPSYLITLIIYSVTNTNVLWASSEEHPPIKLRIDFMLGELARTEMKDLNVGLYDYFNRADELFGLRLKIDTELQIANDERWGFESNYFEITFLENLVRKISEKLDKSFNIEKFSKESFEKSHILAKRLSDGVLISSSPKNSPVYGIAENDLNERVTDFDEYPNKMAEIITAATLCKFDSQINWFLDSFILINRSGYQKCFDDYEKILNNFDLVVSKSIETALVHSYFVNSKEFEEDE